MKEYKYFLDTNIFLRPIVKDDLKKTKECEAVFEGIQKGKIKALTSTLVLAELVWTGISFYKISKKEMIELLKGILKLKGLKLIDKFDLFLAVSLYEARNIKFIDVLIASNPAIFQKKVIVVSYDRDFDKIGVKRIEPQYLS